jgi:hypothetical protein
MLLAVLNPHPTATGGTRTQSGVPPPTQSDMASDLGGGGQVDALPRSDSGEAPVRTSDGTQEATGATAGPDPASVDWDDLAAQAQANFASTGRWFVAGMAPSLPPSPPSAPVGWDALAAEVQANLAATGHWFVAA